MTDVQRASRPDGAAIYEVLRREISTGELAPGSMLREVALSERFSVSRTPIRQALVLLESERLLERAGRGLRVRMPPIEEVIQIYDLRMLLESDAARQAAEARSEVDLEILVGLLERDEGLRDPSDRDRLRTNLEFHSSVWAATHNPILIDLLDRLAAHVPHGSRTTLSVPGRWEQSLSEHRRLFEAILARDAVAAADIAREHMSTARKLRLQLVRDDAAR